jgi:hypothetical protein
MVPSLLPRLAKLAYVTGMLGVVSLGTLNLIAKVVPDVALDGVEVTAKAPTFTFDAVRNEEFQKNATSWFEQHWGLRGYAVRTDNTIVYRLFGESRAGRVVIARSGALISSEDIVYASRDDGRDAVAAMAELVGRVQRKMRRRGNILVPLVIPSKTSFYRHDVPRAWQRRGSYGASDRTLYGTFVEALKNADVSFVDSRALLAEPQNPADSVFAPTGRHWRFSGACRVLQAVLDVARPELPEIGAEQLDCHSRLVADADIASEDYDLFRLLNVWGPPPPGMNVSILDGKRASPALQVPTLLVGSSFVTTFTKVTEHLQALRPSLHYYYDVSVLDTSTLAFVKKVEPFTEQWRADTFGKKLVVLGILETFLPEDGAKFLAEMDKELD